jgi:flagellar motor switch protein FliM
MSNEILTQEEVDALLKGVGGEEDEPQVAEDPGGIRSYNIATQERIVRGRMPTLESINDRFTRLLRIGLFNFMRRSPEVSVGPVRVIKYSEFIRNLVVPTNLNVVQMKPLRGNALFVFEPTLVFLIVDNLFGGDGRFHTRIEGRDFTQTEMRIIHRMLQVVFDEYQKAWQNVYPLSFEYVRSEMHTQFANIATPTEIVVAIKFNIELGSGGGAFHICIPYAALEPIRDLIYSSMQGDQMGPDRRWVRMLSKQVQTAEVELDAQLTTLVVNVQRLLNLKVGDILPVDIPSTVIAQVHNVPLFECGFGAVNGQRALRIERILKPENDNPAGDSHV